MAGNRLPHVATFQDGEGARDWVLGYDQAGSLKAVGDAAGNPVKTIDYDSFGNVVSEEWPWLFLPIGFAGGLRDRNTGFVRFGHRDYDPDIGRFNAQDPMGDSGLGIHPDGNLPGTQGCIGISKKYKNTEELQKILASCKGQYLKVK